jgi:hypothetical protein
MQEPVVPQKPGFCDRIGQDSVRDKFCGSEDVSVRGIADVIQLFKLDATPRKPAAPGTGIGVAEIYDRAYIATLGHSTALPGHVVSPINPRVILFGLNLALAYVRGVQRVELAARARDKAGFNFYLLEFEQACNHTERGCQPGDLFTPRVETDWQSVRVRDDEDLKNTPFDCRQCHQRGRDTSTLLMRELENPWTHFFFYVDNLPGINGSELVQDYQAAKGDEPYGSLPALQILQSTPEVLEGIAGAEQPLVFDAPQIQDERWPEGPDGYASEPLGSPTWENAYAAFKRGEQLALPYLETRATDADKQAALTAAYAQYRAGELSADDLPDLADIFPDDPLTRARIGLQTEPNASPADALIQACGSCHNDVLDQTLTRARFNIAVSRLDRTALDLAIERIQLPRTAPGAMPPPEARQLDPESRERLIDYLRQAVPARDEVLERAAKLGMAEVPVR